jgi:hypothetical protein
MQALSQLSYGPIARSVRGGVWGTELKLRPLLVQAALAAGIVILAFAGDIAELIFGELFLILQQRHRIIVGGL